MAGGVSCVDEFLDQIGLRHHSQKITDCETDMSTLMDFDAQNLLDLGLPLDSTLIILARVAALKTFFAEAAAAAAVAAFSDPDPWIGNDRSDVEATAESEHLCNNADLLYAMGGCRHIGDAVVLYRRALMVTDGVLTPGHTTLCKLGTALHALGTLDTRGGRQHFGDAVACFLEALSQMEGEPTTLFSLGTTLQALGDLDGAAQCFGVAAFFFRQDATGCFHPAFIRPSFLSNLGLALQALEALGAVDWAEDLACEEYLGRGFHNLGVFGARYCGSGYLAAGVHHYCLALQRRPPLGAVTGFDEETRVGVLVSSVEAQQDQGGRFLPNSLGFTGVRGMSAATVTVGAENPGAPALTAESVEVQGEGGAKGMVVVAAVMATAAEFAVEEQSAPALITVSGMGETVGEVSVERASADGEGGDGGGGGLEGGRAPPRDS
eukprot:CAMPEP_0171713236 /NCGR_PEP_ID=MMETSP0991-20121206/17618_1 /TAXON_ID=483369 /ORGANISM="non described non described, Strain CCMP2098" /LENGTH=435 /DNA_ID=CAMNT_0012303825 /DNA_START=245 /DNA_END=1548 /DNA_ORIENTATION=-